MQTAVNEGLQQYYLWHLQGAFQALKVIKKTQKDTLCKKMHKANSNSLIREQEIEHHNKSDTFCS